MRLHISRVFNSWLWVVALFAFAGAGEAMFFGHMQAFTPLYLPHLGVAAIDVPALTGLSVAISSFLGLPFLPFWGALADRYARHPVIVRSFVIHLLAAVIALVAQNVWVFIFARAIMGFTLGNTGLMLATLAERVPSNRQGLAFSFVIAGYSIGVSAGPIAGGPIVDAYGFPTLIVVDAVLLGIIVVAMTWGYRDTFVGTDRGSLLAMAADSLLIIGRTPRLWLLFLAMTCLTAGYLLPMTYLPLVITALYPGAAPGTAVGFIFGVGGLSAVALGPMIGFLADRFGLWRILFLAAIADFVLLPLLALAREPFSFAVTWALVAGFATGVINLTVNVLSSSVTTEVRGRVMGLATIPTNLALMVGPTIGSVVATRALLAIFPLAAVFTALGVVCLIATRRQGVPATGLAAAMTEN